MLNDSFVEASAFSVVGHYADLCAVAIEGQLLCHLQTYARLPSRLSEFLTLLELSSGQTDAFRPGADVAAMLETAF